jgi:hypothetical protein
MIAPKLNPANPNADPGTKQRVAQPAGRWVFCPRLEHPNRSITAAERRSGLRIRRYVYSSVPLLGENTAIATPTTNRFGAAAHIHIMILIQLG